jgi:hypothetical protein
MPNEYPIFEHVNGFILLRKPFLFTERGVNRTVIDCQSLPPSKVITESKDFEDNFRQPLLDKTGTIISSHGGASAFPPLPPFRPRDDHGIVLKPDALQKWRREAISDLSALVRTLSAYCESSDLS